jgi:hypothetical protein
MVMKGDEVKGSGWDGSHHHFSSPPSITTFRHFFLQHPFKVPWAPVEFAAFPCTGG